MKPARNPAPGLIQLLSRATVVSEIHGISVETVLAHWLALASTVAGDLVDSKPYSGSPPIKAKVSLLLVTNDGTMPLWARTAAEGVLRRQNEILSHREARKPTEEVIAVLEQKKRALMELGHGPGTFLGRDVPDPVLIAIDEKIRLVGNLRRYRHLRRVSSRGDHPAPIEGFTCSLLAEGKKDYMNILRNHDLVDEAEAAAATSGSNEAMIVGWLAEPDLLPVAKRAGFNGFGKLGWMVAAPSANGVLKPTARLPVDVDLLLENVEIMRLTAMSYHFDPHPVARDFLDRQVEEVGYLTGRLPKSHIPHAIHDPYLAWHLGGLLAVVTGDSSATAMMLGCKLGSFLASRIIRHHLHRWRKMFPGDSHGEFEGLDLSILRSLTNQPQTIRSIQRRLRGVSKTRCLVTLHRAVDADLAVCVNGERFITAPPPPPGLGLSESLSEMDAATAFPTKLCPKSPDGTDRRK